MTRKKRGAGEGEEEGEESRVEEGSANPKEGSATL